VPVSLRPSGPACIALATAGPRSWVGGGWGPAAIELLFSSYSLFFILVYDNTLPQHCVAEEILFLLLLG